MKKIILLSIFLSYAIVTQARTLSFYNMAGTNINIGAPDDTRIFIPPGRLDFELTPNVVSTFEVGIYYFTGYEIDQTGTNQYDDVIVITIENPGQDFPLVNISYVSNDVKFNYTQRIAYASGFILSLGFCIFGLIYRVSTKMIGHTGGGDGNL